jgi:hypothetical protein
MIPAAWRLPAIAALLALASVSPAGRSYVGAAAPSPAAPFSAACLQVQALNFSSTQISTTLRMWTPRLMNAAEPYSLQGIALTGGDRRPADRRSLIPDAGRSLTTICLPPPPGAAPPLDADGQPATALSSVAVSPGSQPFAGYPTVGKLFFKVEGVRSEFCTASVINSYKPPKTGSMLILTAAHCVDGTFMRLPYFDKYFSFAPGWAHGHDPYGLWGVAKVYVVNKWLECPVPYMDCHTDPIFDYAVMRVAPLHEMSIASATGANGWNSKKPKQLHDVQIVGYSENKSVPWRANTNTVTVTKHNQSFRSGNGRGLGPGSSGGPWFGHLKAHQGAGILVADTGGWEQGGPNSGNPSYSDFWNIDFAELVHLAAIRECKKCS